MDQNELTDFQRYCAGLDVEDLLIIKAKLLREKHTGERMKSASWVALANEMLEAVRVREEYLAGIKLFKKITHTAAEFNAEYGQSDE